MSVYNITTAVNYYAEFKALATADANLDIVYDDGVDDLVLYHNGLEIYLELDDLDSAASPKIWCGISWTSGETLNDRFQVNSPASILSGSVIVGATYIIVGWYANAGGNGYAYFGALSNGDKVCVGHNGTIQANYSKTYNMTRAQECKAILFKPLLGTAYALDGAYASLPLYLATITTPPLVCSDGAGMPHYVDGLRILLRAANTSSVPFEVYGTDLILNAYEDAAGVTITDTCLLGAGLYV